MKKTIYLLVSTLAVVVSLAACGKKDSGGGSSGDGGGTVATTPNQPCNIPGNSSCTPNVYQQYAPNFQNFQYGNANGFCGCPAGYRPVMNVQWGISCAPDNWFPASAYYQAYNYNTVMYYSQNNQWTSIPQITYSPGTSGYNNSCATAASVCDTRLTNPNTGSNPQCGNGGYCRSTSGGSYVGLCTIGAGHDVYSQPQGGGYGCMRWSSYYGWVNVCGYNGGGAYYGGGFYYGTQLPR